MMVVYMFTAEHAENIISSLSAISGVNVIGNLQNNKSIKIESFKYCEI